MKSLLLMVVFIASLTTHAAEKIKIVGADSIAPMMWSENGKASGFAFEIAKAAFEKAGYQVELVACPWARCQQIAAEEGAFIVGFSKTEERLKKFVYSEPMYFDEVSMVTLKGKEFPFSKNEDLKGKKIGSLFGATFGERFEEIKKIITLDSDQSDEQRIKKLQAGRVDGAVFSLAQTGLNYAAKKAGVDPSLFTVLPEKIAADPNFIGTGINTPDAKVKLEKLNKALKELEASGKIKEIMAQKY